AIKPHFLVAQSAEGGHEDDWGLALQVLSSTSANIKAINTRQHQVENDDVITLCGQQMQGGQTVSSEVEGITILAQKLEEIFGKIHLVFDNEQSQRRSASCHSIELLGFNPDCV